MKIIILGANKVGASLAENLAKEDNDITVVDSNEVLLRELKDRLDIGTSQGQPSFPDVLANAGAKDPEKNLPPACQFLCQFSQAVFSGSNSYRCCHQPRGNSLALHKKPA